MREAVSTVLFMSGLVVLALGIIALFRGHLDWMRVSSRKFAAWVSAGAFVVMLVGGGFASPSEKDADTTASPATTMAAPGSTSETASVTTTAEPVALAAPAAAAAAESPDMASAAQAKLATLEVKGRAPKTGYDRDLFGQAWSDDVTVEGGRNGCDTRNDILRRDLTAITIKPGSNGCTVLTGTLNDTYTANTIAFTRGEDTSGAVQIDHVVALSDAWQKGAQQLDEQTRRNFANDPLNLQAVDGPTNQQKSDGDAATWLPPNNAYRCTYIARQIDVKANYRLWVAQAEKDAMSRALETCGAPASAAPAEAPAPAPGPGQAPAPVPAPKPVESAPIYANCDAVREAGAAPLYAGQPGYSTKLDRDRDGVACE